MKTKHFSIFHFALLCMLTLGALGSCAKIDELNDYNTVVAFEIKEHKAASGGVITLGDVTVTGNEIHIPVLYGVHNFPHIFKGEPKFANPIDRVTGIDFSDWIVIDVVRDSEGNPVLTDGKYLFDEPKFYVQAVSGLPKEYVFKTDYITISDDTDIAPEFTFTDATAGVLVADRLTIEAGTGSAAANVACIYTARTSWPFCIKPEFKTIDKNAIIADNGKRIYTFENHEAVQNFTVEAADGGTKVWELRLKDAPVVNRNSAEIDESALSPTNLMDVQLIAISKGFSIEEHDFRASSPAAPSEDSGGKYGGNSGNRSGGSTWSTGNARSNPGSGKGVGITGNIRSGNSNNAGSAGNGGNSGNARGLISGTGRNGGSVNATHLDHNGQSSGGNARMARKPGERSDEYIPSDTLIVYIATYGTEAFPATISLNPGNGSDVSVIGQTDKLTFADYGDTKDFYMIDVLNGITRHWVVKLERYISPYLGVESASFTYEPAQVKPRTGSGLPNPSPTITLDTINTSIDHLGHKIYLHMIKHVESAESKRWRVDAVVRLLLTNGMYLDVVAFWNGSWTAWQTPFNFKITTPDGRAQSWQIVIQDWRNGEPAKSDKCELLDASILEIRPFTAKVNNAEPLTMDREKRTIAINLAADDNAYPMSVMFDYGVSPGARISSQNGGRSPIVFNSATATAFVDVVSENGQNTARWSVSLTPPPREAGADVKKMQILSFSNPGTTCDVETIDPETGMIGMKFTKLGGLPVTMKFRMILSHMATSDVTDAEGYGSFTFNKIEDKAFTVTAQNGATRQWTLHVECDAGLDKPQLENWQFESWIDDYTPSPHGVKGSPYWATPNMTSPIKVLNTRKTAGDTGHGSAVEIKTINAVIKKASGSLFLGWFDAENAQKNMNDPTKITFIGIPFFAISKIRGMEVDILYHPGKGPGSDTGSLAIELINQRNPSEDFVYHGWRPKSEKAGYIWEAGWHPDNNADRVARGRVLVGTQAGTQDGETIKVVTDNQWVKSVFVPLEYSGSYPAYTHIGVIFASSSEGDSFKGEVGSILNVDNVKLIYE